jgi:hypothetical protein
MGRTRKSKAASGTSKPTCASQASSNKSTTQPKPYLPKLKELAAKKTKQYLHSKNTTEAYDGYVKRGKEFLASFVETEGNAKASWKARPSQGLSGDGEDEIKEDNTLLCSNPNFHRAFDGRPIESTPQAITMFLAWKCFKHENGKATADGIHTAFLTEYNQL